MNTPPINFGSVGILGFGTMGAGVAQVLAASGRSVTVLETDRERIASGLDRVGEFLDSGIARGKVSEAERVNVLERIWGTTVTADLSAVDLVIESVSEDFEIKRSALTQVAAVVGAGVPLLSNTSALSITELAAALPGPGRVAGLHFFNPAPIMRTVEVIPGMQTDHDLVPKLVDLVDSLDGKVPVVVKDRPGFLINALLLPYLNDVIQEFDDQLATAEDIDVALELGLGYRTGPLAMLDMIGLDIHLHATEALHAATLDGRYAPPPLLRQMVADGRLGDKVGRGFRAHSSDSQPSPSRDRTSS